jgi:dTDP-4-amino-4,6-dideoxygalactose transaminase
MKTDLEQLAVFGSVPTFAEKLYVGRPNIGSKERLLKRINSILDTRWLSNNGPLVQEFEQRIADFLGVKHCVTVCNATIGLQIAAKACGLSGEVIIPSFTFIATAHALQWINITPIFCDINFNHTIDPERIEQLITSRTTGIIGVHLWGHTCEVQALSEIAVRHHLKLLFDAAHAFGCSYQGQMIGNFGDAEVFSFHATKFCNSFEGGAITTNCDRLAAKLRLMNNFGFAGYDRVVELGINGKMSEVSAAMGLTSLESLEEFITINQENYQQYQQELADISGIKLFSYDGRQKYNYQYIVLEIDKDITKISRDELQEILWAENIIARRYFYPGCHQMEPYRQVNYVDLIPNTKRLTSRVLVLPTGTSVSSQDITNICQIIRLVISQASEIQKRLHYQKVRQNYAS